MDGWNLICWRSEGGRKEVREVIMNELIYIPEPTSRDSPVTVVRTGYSGPSPGV
jgi:hypothetical protein